jgi:hypothetical protein
VLVVIGLHRADQADVIHALAQVREEIADQRAALAAGRNSQPGLSNRRCWFESPPPMPIVLPSAAKSFGLVERVHVRHAAIGEDEDDALGAGRKMRRLRRERIGGRGPRVGQQVDTMPGSSSDAPTSERSTWRRLGIGRESWRASVEVDEFVEAEQHPHRAPGSASMSASTVPSARRTESARLGVKGCRRGFGVHPDPGNGQRRA